MFEILSGWFRELVQLLSVSSCFTKLVLVRLNMTSYQLTRESPVLWIEKKQQNNDLNNLVRSSYLFLLNLALFLYPQHDFWHVCFQHHPSHHKFVKNAVDLLNMLCWTFLYYNYPLTLSMWKIRSSSQTFSKHLSRVSTKTWMRSRMPSSDSELSTQNTK